MNKKFSTLLASFLLAGGLFSTADAQVAMSTAEEGQYYYLHLEQSGSAATENSSITDGNHKRVKEDTVDPLDKNYWWRVEAVKTTVNGSSTVIGYKLINGATGNALSVTKDSKTYDVFENGAGAGLMFAPGVGYEGTGSASANAYTYMLCKIEPISYDALDLNAILGTNFGLQIGYETQNASTKKWSWSEYTSFEGENVFAGSLYAEAGTNGVALYKDAAKTKRIVLTKSKWNVSSSALSENLKFAVVSTKNFKATDYTAVEFIISVPAIVAGDPVEVVATDGTTKYEVVVSVVKNAAGENVNRLTVAEDIEVSYADYTAQYDNANNGNTYIKLGANNLIDTDDFIGKLWNIKKNGRVLSPACGEGEIWVAASEVNLNGAEGLWLWNNEGYFDNRESSMTWVPSGLRYTDTENVYVSGGDVYEITPAGTPASTWTTAGYLGSYSNDQLKQKAFFIGTPRSTGDTVYIAKNSKNVLTFTLDKAEAVEFRLTKQSWGSYEEGLLVNDYSYLKDGAVKAGKDVVKMYQYVITEAVSGKALIYDDANGYYKLGTLSNNETTQTYVLKEKGTDLYNILMGVEVEGSYKYSNKTYNTVNAAGFCDDVTKLYGAHNTGRLVRSESAYANVENDLFVVVDAEAQQYRGDFSNTGVLDTIKIFRNDDNSYVLYEKGALLKDADNEVLEGFLGLENIYDPQYAEVNPALVADTAKHANTWRPQYMLAVETNVVPAGKYCEIHGANAGCKDEHLTETRGYTEGRYLVNLVDSTKYPVYRSDCKFQNYRGDNYYRLGFVAAKHMGDSLIIASTNDTINVKDGDDEVCTFAFKYVDGNRDAFVIETLYDYSVDVYGTITEKSRGYVKFHNGIPVVTLQRSEAEVFDLEVLEGVEATANEEIAAAGVTVIAGNGQITIAGAAGKKVVIANILGQTVANTIITSDNATIAAPAGVVVVKVEGEAAVKAIVK